MSKHSQLHRFGAARSGVTLFEVMLSMLIVAIAILSTALMLPAGLKAQEGARYRAVASITAYNLINLAEHTRPYYYRMKTESVLPEGTQLMTHEPGKWDMERILTSSYWAKSAIIPVPPAIARRLDSDSDEIAKILDEGGQIYFPSPLPASLGDFEGNTRRNAGTISMVDETIEYAFDGFEEAQRLVIGFIGYPQQNALPTHPMTAGPYRDWYPRPPITYVGNHDLPEGLPSTTSNPWMANNGNIELALWEMWKDRIATGGQVALYDAMLATFADFTDVAPANGASFGGALFEMAHGESTLDTFRIGGYHLGDETDYLNTDLRDEVIDHYNACEAFLNDLLGTVFNPLESPDTTVGTYFPVTGHPDPFQLIAMRNLAAAAMWRTRTDRIDGTPAPPALSAADMSKYLNIHEQSLRWAAAYAAHRPYDWGTSRMLNRPTMLDRSLVQFDLFDGSGNWSTSGDNVWPSSQPGYSPVYHLVTPKGCTAHHGGSQAIDLSDAAERPAVWASGDASRLNDIPSNYYGNWDSHDGNYQLAMNRMSQSWGRAEHYNLNKPFESAERCRQMVIWAVDWQKYEDAELTPAVVSDASYYPNDAATARALFNSGLTYGVRGRGNIGYLGPLGQPLLWKKNPIDTATGLPAWTGTETTGVAGFTVKTLWRGVTTTTDKASAGALRGDTSMRPWLGAWGLDANGNGEVNQGPIPKSMRMRASVVARFNFYDQRTWHSVRN